ncbi:glutamate/aspartate ABC transporter substrate-binding protein [Accumulibacter sp.]|uniref:glutamate/aspartate ABC transporter substrate-binding protein n=1 Tax=Accumulibacter sp. TaxID=2053492 RepID=UPI0025DF60A9|nr:glutamate/aspartate ABC transporter substrate-binding protein [Accumulibacter sp.]MCP5228421.1 glutamate/aspartate ABC transporter substrate-binding protein [Accumulibacter sp.]
MKVIGISWRLLFTATLATALLSSPTLAKAKSKAKAESKASKAAPAPVELTGTLKKIKDSGVITVGHREESIPFSYYDDKRQVIGYSQDLVEIVIEAIKADLQMAEINVKMVPVTSANRIELVEEGTVDIECGSTTNNRERQKKVSFSNTIFIISTRLLTKADSGVTDFSDLSGKNVVTTKGTTSERLLRQMNKDKKLNMSIIAAKDHGEAFLLLETRRAVAFMMDDALLYGEMANARHPEAWRVVGTPQSFEAYGCILPKYDSPFKKVVDEALATAMTSGEAEAIYSKWFLQPIPPKGLNLNFPLSDAMKALYKAPNDKPYE